MSIIKQLQDQNKEYEAAIQSIFSIGYNIKEILDFAKIPQVGHAKFSPPSQQVIDTINATLSDIFLKAEFNTLLTFKMPDLPLIDIDSKETFLAKGKNDISRETAEIIQTQIKILLNAYGNLPTIIPENVEVYDIDNTKISQEPQSKVSTEEYATAIKIYNETIENINIIKLAIRSIIKHCSEYIPRVSEFNIINFRTTKKPLEKDPELPKDTAQELPKYDWLGRRITKNTQIDDQVILLTQKLKVSNYLLSVLSRISLSSSSKLDEKVSTPIIEGVKEMNNLYEKFIENAKARPKNIEELKTNVLKAITEIKLSLPVPEYTPVMKYTDKTLARPREPFQQYIIKQEQDTITRPIQSETNTTIYPHGNNRIDVGGTKKYKRKNRKTKRK